MQARNEPLDWLRGLLALSIMLYHLTAWEVAQPTASSLLGRLGIYGVSMFFILSGLSIALVYHCYVVSTAAAGRFLVRRVMRIWPLLWLAVLATWVLREAQGVHYSWKLVALNLTTLFGFVQPSAYIATGAWSIGNEMVYYALTPLLLAAYNRKRLLGNLVTLAAVALGLVFSHGLLSPQVPLAQQWKLYINPFNNLFLYCAGIAMFYNADHLRPRPAVSAALLAAGVAVFVAYPVDGDQIHIVTGWGRVVFCAASLAIVLAFYKATVRTVPFVTAPLMQLGLATYGVYLLHPVLWLAVKAADKALGLQLAGTAVFAATALATIAAAMLTYRRLELPFIALGKRLTSQRAAPGLAPSPR